MKREIKFRVWDKSKKCFIPEEYYAIINRTGFQAFGIIIKDWVDYREGEYFYDSAQILCQFTGLKDKNGKEIYEGDIVFYEDHEWKVEWWYDRWDMVNGERHVREDDLSDDPGFTEWSYCEVIGNIYETPELL